MKKITNHKDGSVSIKMSKELAQRLALSMPELYNKCKKFDDFVNDLNHVEVNGNTYNEASELHSELNSDKIWNI